MADKAELLNELHSLLDTIGDDRLPTIGSWIRMMARKTGTPPTTASSSGPLTDMLHIKRIDSGNGRAVYELEVAPEILNPNGVLAGPAVYAMVDYSMGAAAASSLEAGQICATIEIKMSYLSSIRSGRVRAETEVVRHGRQIVFLESKVRDESGKLIATASGSFIVIAIPPPQQSAPR
ncbi:MAG TPA: PaaI family thioesterase [Candidatus Binataceae bacterium]|nr:PaaI family thioesterase [Candidatus Binataceae bacterium]